MGRVLCGDHVMRHVLVVYPDEWLSYSPTVLNLVRVLEAAFTVTLVAIDDGTFRNRALENDRFKFIRVNTLAAKFLRRLRPLYAVVKAILLLVRLRAMGSSRQRFDEVIAIDSVGLWVVQRIFPGNCHFLSLELKRDVFFRRSDKLRVDSVIIQSAERMEALFGTPMPNVHLIQNSPIVNRATIADNAKHRFDGRLIFLGNILPAHGVYKILDAIEQEAAGRLTITLKGMLYKPSVKSRIKSRYHHLISSGKICLDESYTRQEDIVSYLNGFSAGFCLYDFDYIPRDDFNYLSSPSGKLFNYYAAGLPVIGSDILGLSSTREFNAGILIQELSARSILRAISEIESGYEQFSRNCIRAALHFDFAEAANRYSSFLQSRTNQL
jgi:glycosyltransferase involved in cell wall biosynthesis